MMLLRDVAKKLGRSAGTVRNYCRHEDLPHRREGRAGIMVFDEVEVDEWLARPETQAMLRYGEILKAGRRAVLSRGSTGGSAA